MAKLNCFKAYDIRGELGEELNEDIAYRIGRAYGEFLKPKTIVVGGDVRLTSESLKLALANGLMDAGTDVLDIGLSGTEEIYFATFHLGVDGGIEVTASHNPMNYNGMKLVRENAKPISGDTGLRDIQRLAEENQFPPVDPARRGTLRQISVLKEYVDHLMGYVDLANFTRPLKLVVNSGNGAAGHVIDEVEKRFAAAGAPVTDSKSMFQSRPSGEASTGAGAGTGVGAGAATATTGAGAGAGLGAATGAPTPSSPARASRSLSIRLGSAGAGCTPCSRLSNMSRTAAVENRMTSITSGVISSSPLRSLSKRFSVR